MTHIWEKSYPCNLVGVYIYLKYINFHKYIYVRIHNVYMMIYMNAYIL